ncbi:MAG TPA: hypothetical protein VK797_21605 [Tepidisphaeraceae bacterium]|nr:hypothetical protein [Tepidisphaeraceae bacterium]
MKSVSRFASSILAAGLLAGSPAVVFAADPPPTQPAPESKLVTDIQADAKVREAISSIEKAPDPSSAVEAYAKAAGTNSVPLKQAYVKRLVTLGVPELAEVQSRDLVQNVPDDGLAWAVVAFMDARRKNMPASLYDIVIAVRRAADDPFVLRTAAQILAYYEVYGDPNKMEAGLRESVAQARIALSAKPAFAQAYREAKRAYMQAAARLTAPVGAEAVAPPGEPYPVTTVEPSAPPPIVYNNTYNTYTAAYPDPYAYDENPLYPWWPSGWWWDPGIVIVDGDRHDRFDDRFHDRDDRLDGRRDHGIEDRRGRESDAGARSSDDQEFRGGSAGMRVMPPARVMPARPSTPPRSSGGSWGEGGRSFGSPMNGGGQMGGGGGHAGGGGGHR